MSDHVEPEQPRMIALGEFTMSSARAGEVHTVSLFGELDLATIEGVELELLRVEATDALSLVVDLSGLTSLDSSGVRLLLAAQAREHAGANRLVLLRAPAPVQRVFELSGVEGVLPFAD